MVGLFCGSIGYAPFIYNMFSLDSNEILAKGLLHGNIDKEKSPVIYYRKLIQEQQNSIKVIPYEDIKFGKPIGSGGYGEVFKGRWKHTDVAIKKILGKSNTEDQVDDFLKEVGLMSRLSHPNILLFIGVCVDASGLYIITEYMLRGSLFAVLYESKEPVSQKLLVQMLIDAARGMLYLHQYNPTIIHRDLKPQNLLVDKYWNVKVCDFGLSRIKASETMSRLGTIHYSPPEILRGERYTEKADIFSFSIVMWELFTRDVPYAGMAPLMIASSVAYKNRRPKMNESIPPSIRLLISECWEETPELRPDFYEILDRLTELHLLIEDEDVDDFSQNVEMSDLSADILINLS